MAPNRLPDLMHVLSADAQDSGRLWPCEQPAEVAIAFDGIVQARIRDVQLDIIHADRPEVTRYAACPFVAVAWLLKATE
jgi:hypothetical protein